MKADSREIAGAVSDVLEELDRAMQRFPSWPTDPIHAATIIGEELGELQQAVLQRSYGPVVGLDKVKEEAVQTAAMAVRFLLSIHEYKFAPSDQHEQSSPN